MALRNRGGGDTREQLLRAGLEELNQHGIHDFSTRRVAKQCGLSSAAPYKHFKDTHAFIAAILQSINRAYAEHQAETLKRYADCSTRRQLLEASLDYLRFLAEHPEFRRVIMQSYRNSDSEYQILRGKLSVPLYKVVARYCREVNMPPDVRKRKAFVVRSIIYGAALFFDNGEMPYNEESMSVVSAMLDREFDLP